MLAIFRYFDYCLIQVFCLEFYLKSYFMVYREGTSNLRLKKSKRLRWMALAEMGKNRMEQAIFVLNQKPSSLGSSRMRNVCGWCRYFGNASTATGSVVKCVTISSIQSAPTLPTQVMGVLNASVSTHSYKATPPIIKTGLRVQQFREFRRHSYFFHHFDVTSGYFFSVTVRSMEVTHSLHILWFMFGAVGHAPVDGSCFGK